jgi:hypothetical protein
MLTFLKVVVGGSAGLVYTPDTIEAAIGDMVIFTFESQNHTATQSAFTTPCEKLAGGMDSGFMPNLNNSVVPPPQMAMQVTVATPICKFISKASMKYYLTLLRVLLPTIWPLWKGNDLFYQSNSQQDPSHVPTNGNCTEWYRSYSCYCWRNRIYNPCYHRHHPRCSSYYCCFC